MKIVEVQSKNEVTKTKAHNPIIGEFQKSTTLASMESLSMPEVHEVVFLADFRCSKCQERVAEVMSKMNGQSSFSLHAIISMFKLFPLLETSTMMVVLKTLEENERF
ncbi:hypothetical protein Leryth_021321 [Lithospermum erythrorhizon]|nr:hypothetical protein Leryth_021321 [Lithospermum erythrorhizon]